MASLRDQPEEMAYHFALQEIVDFAQLYGIDTVMQDISDTYSIRLKAQDTMTIDIGYEYS